MARIEHEKKQEFIPYKLVIETTEEHDFLRGLLNGSDSIRKRDCNDYNSEIGFEIFKLISATQKKEG